jgi:hypothetical protein
MCQNKDKEEAGEARVTRQAGPKGHNGLADSHATSYVGALNFQALVHIRLGNPVHYSGSQNRKAQCTTYYSIHTE